MGEERPERMHEQGGKGSRYKGLCLFFLALDGRWRDLVRLSRGGVLVNNGMMCCDDLNGSSGENALGHVAEAPARESADSSHIEAAEASLMGGVFLPEAPEASHIIHAWAAMLSQNEPI